MMSDFELVPGAVSDCELCGGRGCRECVQPGAELVEDEDFGCSTCQGRGCRECTQS